MLALLRDPCRSVFVKTRFQFLATSLRNNKIALARVRPRASRCAPTACVRARRPEPPLRWAHCRTRRRGRWPGSWPTVRKSRSQRGLHPLTPWPCTYEMNEVIRGHQRSLSGNQRSSTPSHVREPRATGRHGHRESRDILCHERKEGRAERIVRACRTEQPRRGDQAGILMKEVIRGHQRSSEVIRGHQRSSEVIRGDQADILRSLSGEQRESVPKQCPSVVIVGHQWTRIAISGHLAAAAD